MLLVGLLILGTLGPITGGQQPVERPGSIRRTSVDQGSIANWRRYHTPADLALLFRSWPFAPYSRKCWNAPRCS